MAIQKPENTPTAARKRVYESVLILAFFFAIFLVAALSTYHRGDPGWSHTVAVVHVSNAAGRVGAWVADLAFYILGLPAYLLPLFVLFGAWVNFRLVEASETKPHSWTIRVARWVGMLLIFATVCALCHLFVPSNGFELPFQSGGILGYMVSIGLEKSLNFDGTVLALIAFLLIGITFVTGLSWLHMLECIGVASCYIGHLLKRVFLSLYEYFAESWKKDTEEDEEFEDEVPVINRKKEKKYDDEDDLPVVVNTLVKKEKQNEPLIQLPLVREKKPEKPRSNVVMTSVLDMSQLAPNEMPHPGALPPLSLLDPVPPPQNLNFSVEELQARSREVELRLADFGIEAQVMAVHPGPVVTRFELDLAAGTKVGKITNLAKDLARSLSVISVRVVEVIPGKSYIGLELPNPQRELVTLREVLSSHLYESSHSSLSLALGKDIAGDPVVVDLAKMPHLLVAGTTGSGKSVGVNSMLMSLLFKSTPEQLRLILIDPKMLELSIYDNIPHLLAPVVTDMNDAAKSLRWCVVEMERRYRLMATLGVRNIGGYNQKVKEAKEKGAPLLDPILNVANTDESSPVELKELPKIVVVADEFADMMVVVGKKVETLIARLAQKARAAGIHLIFATQRPSVDVITGLIKANIPTRIAFQVSSKIDSRTILDQSGAEQLLGNGDMLYLAPGTGVPVRVHGAFVSDDEVHRVVDYLRLTGSPEFVQDVLEDAGEAGEFMDSALKEGASDGEKDELYDQAVEFIVQARRVSVSSIQRRFKIGYNRAATIVEAMEAAGVVSPMEGAGNREVLVPISE